MISPVLSEERQFKVLALEIPTNTWQYRFGNYIGEKRHVGWYVVSYWSW